MIGNAGLPGPASTVSMPGLWTGVSVLAAALVSVTSLSGILLEQTYARETASWAAQAAGQDWANPAVVALLLAATLLARRGSIGGYLAWLGAWLYLVYAFAIYAFAVRFQFLFLAYVAVLGLSFYALGAGRLRAYTGGIASALRENPRARTAGALLAGIGVLFGALWLSEIVPHLLAGTIPASLAETGLLTNPVQVLDLAFLLPGMVVTGALLWKGESLGSLMAVPLLVFAAAMSLGILAGFAVVATRGLPYPLPAAVIVGAIIVLSTVVAWLFLRHVRTGRGLERVAA